jgi:hypothetical protein
MTQTAPTSDAISWLWWTLFVIVALVLLVVLYAWRRGRKLPGDHVFRASRLSRGNHLFPAQVIVTPSSITLFHPQWIGKLEESIHMAHVASIKIDTHMVFSDITIETSGGQDPIQCHGHPKADAVAMKDLIEKYQSGYYAGEKGAPPK